MREILVSVDVYAKIWSLRAAGEENEDAILSRVLAAPSYSNISVGIVSSNSLSSAGNKTNGILDSRFGVEFQEGFEVFRHYLGREFRAKIKNGKWQLEGDFPPSNSLNELSKAVGARTENAWLNWKFKDALGRIRAVSDLRNTRPPLEQPANTQGEDSTMKVGKIGSHGTWPDDLVEAFNRLPEIDVPLAKLYRVARAVRSERGHSVPVELEATIRERLESHSSDSDNFKGGKDLFYII